MKILVVSALTQPMTSERYAPVERHAHRVALGLKERAHVVTVVGLQGSEFPEDIEFLEAKSGSEEQAYNELYKKRLEEFDCVLDFSSYKWSYIYKADEKKDLPLIGVVYPGQDYASAPPVPFPCLVGASDAHAQWLSRTLGVAARVVYFGFPAAEPGERGERMLYLGKFRKEKGPQIAIDVARQTRIPLDLVGEDVVIPDQRFTISLLQRCDGRFIRSIGGVKEARKNEFISKARCVILPYLSDEVAYACLPAIEALQHGIPVVALNRGAIGELVRNKINGFAVSTQKELVDAVKIVRSLDPSIGTSYPFTLEKSVEDYLRLIEDVMGGMVW